MVISMFYGISHGFEQVYMYKMHCNYCTFLTASQKRHAVSHARLSNPGAFQVCDELRVCETLGVDGQLGMSNQSINSTKVSFSKQTRAHKKEL